jgi:hypothetical protein
MIVRVVGKLTTIVGLEDTWWSLLGEDGEECKSNTRCLFQRECNLRQLLDAMVDVVQEIIEHSIGHTLEINEVHLPMNTVSFRNHVLDPRHGLLAAQYKDALRTYIGEHFAHILRDIAKLVERRLLTRD